MAPIRSAIMMLLAGEVVEVGMGEALEDIREGLDGWGELEIDAEWDRDERGEGLYRAYERGLEGEGELEMDGELDTEMKGVRKRDGGFGGLGRWAAL